MKRPLFFTLLSVFCLSIAFGQSARQVKWTFTAKKISNNIYELHMQATLNGKYHIYSLDGGDGPLSTSFTYTANPLVTIDGKPKEKGKLVKKYEEVFKSEVRYFEKTVTFVQTIKLKNKVKTNVAGKVEFLLCDDHECLPPDETSFSVAVGG